MEVRKRLEDGYFESRVLTDLEPIGVVLSKYGEHAEILNSSVATWERNGQRFFLMKDELAVKGTIEHDATRIAETDFVVGLQRILPFRPV